MYYQIADFDFVVDLFDNKPESTMQFDNFGHIGVGNFSTCRGRWNGKAHKHCEVWDLKLQSLLLVKSFPFIYVWTAFDAHKSVV